MDLTREQKKKKKKKKKDVTSEGDIEGKIEQN